MIPRLTTMQDAERPSLAMVRGARVLKAEGMLPAELYPATMRDVFRTMVEFNVCCFINENDVFVTMKTVIEPQGMKRVDITDLAPSMQLPVVRDEICTFFLNELLPVVQPEDVAKWSLEFLIDFDKVLSLKISSTVRLGMKNHNFRTLKHRIMTQKLSGDDIALVQNMAPHMNELLALFQNF